MDIEKFLENLSSDSPTPGGGSASALSGAISASLLAMVAGLTLKKDQSKMGEMEGIRKRAMTIQRRLLKAVDEDSSYYQEVIKAFRLPKETEKQRLHRSKMIQRAYQKATLTPRLVCAHAIELLEYSKILVLKGNPLALSDAGVGAFLADTALKGGLMNIWINLGSMQDRTFIHQMDSFMKKMKTRRSRLFGRIEKALSKEG